MRKYDIYVIDQDIVEDYIGRENKLFKLFYEYSISSPLEKYMLEKYIQCITNTIPTRFMNTQLEEQLSFLEAYYYYNGKHYINYGEDISTVEVTVHANKIAVVSDGTFLAETVMFDNIGQAVNKLGLLQGSFLVIDLESKRYGWLCRKNALNCEKSV